MKHDLIDVIETAYSAVPGDDAAWLKKLAEAVRPALDFQGGAQEPQAWLAAFGVLAAGIMLGPLALRLSKQ